LCAGQIFHAGTFDDWPELEFGVARPSFHDRDRLIEVRDLEDSITTDGLFEEGAVRHLRLSAVDLDGRSGVGRLQLVPSNDRALL
jgi:hypothetical protein